jgi:hypothetical protein
MQGSTADSTNLTDIRIQQYTFEMCTAKLYGHYIDPALSIDTRTNTKYRNMAINLQQISRPQASFVLMDF